MTAIRGALVTLRPVSEETIARAHTRFQDPVFWNALQWTGAPPLDRFRHRVLKTKHVRLWEIVPEGLRTAVGYVGYRAQAGVPFLFLVFFDTFDAAVAQEALSPAIHHYFTVTWAKYTDYQRDFPLAIYLDRGIANELHQFLVENGFDPLQFVSDLDNDKMIGYELRPQTYEAYYGGGDDGEEPFARDDGDDSDFDVG